MAIEQELIKKYELPIDTEFLWVYEEDDLVLCEDEEKHPIVLAYNQFEFEKSFINYKFIKPLN